MTEQATGWAPIVKTVKNDDGTLYVYGKVSDDTLDRDQQICDADWLGKAVPEWFAEGGNIREQHSSVAAGVAVEHEAKADGHYVKALIVDPTSVKKVEHDVLKGFSIGIKRPRVTLDKSAPGGRIVDGKIVEISLVDRPCNPACSMTVVKADSNGAPTVPTQQFVEQPVPKFEQATFTKDAGTIPGTAAALRALAGLIAHEAADLADGDWSEALDISTLLGAVWSLQEFARREATEPATTTDLGGHVSTAPAEAASAALETVPLPGGIADPLVGSGAKADTPAAPAAPEAPAATDTPAVPAGETADKADTPEVPAQPEFLTKAEAGDFITKADLSDTLSALLTKAMEPVLDRLAKVEATPTPGGPVITRTSDQQAAATAHDARVVKAEVDELLEKADAATNTVLAQGYRDRAAALASRLA